MAQKTLTLGEIAAVEQITGVQYEDPDQPRGKYLAALVVVLKKREVMKRRAAGEDVPDFTLADALNMDAQDASDVIAEYFGDLEAPLDQNN